MSLKAGTASSLRLPLSTSYRAPFCRLLYLRDPCNIMHISGFTVQVVAPVRETAAQALGSAARGLSGGCLQVLVRHLTALVDQKEWGVRLAGLLGIKYVLAARLDQAGALLPAVLPAVLTGLKVCFWHEPSCAAEHALQ